MRGLGIGLDRVPQTQGGLITQANLGGQFLCGFALTNAPQEQHDLHRRQMRLVKDRAAVQVVRRSATRAAIRRQITAPRTSKDAGLRDQVLAAWTFQLTRMKMLNDPSNTTLVIKEIGNWEFHAPSLPAPHTFAR